MDTLASRAIAYLNVDISVFGPGGLRPRATPQLDELIKEASKMVFIPFYLVHITMLWSYRIFSLFFCLKVPDPDEPSRTLYDTMMSHHPLVSSVLKCPATLFCSK
jgi:N-acetylated-alpha-linked acidic dipeptidase